MRARKTPALFSVGLRPFFLLGALWAALSMALWVSMLAGRVTLPTALDPVSWHAHALLFGHVSAIVAGFLLTAVPSWTGRPPLTGWPLAGLVALLVPGATGRAAAQHLWMAGAIGVMTLAVMTRATLGHTGRALTADAATTAIYLAVIASVLVRIAAGLLPGWSAILLVLSGLAWIAAFAAFAVRYAGPLLRPRVTG